MNATVETKNAIKGGEFLIRETQANEIFIPEEWSEEQRMIAKTCLDFVKQEISPRLDEIDSMKDPKLMPSLLDKAGALGLLGTSVPESLGGFGMSFNTTMLVAEVLGGVRSIRYSKRVRTTQHFCLQHGGIKRHTKAS